MTHRTIFETNQIFYARFRANFYRFKEDNVISHHIYINRFMRHVAVGINIIHRKV